MCPGGRWWLEVVEEGLDCLASFCLELCVLVLVLLLLAALLLGPKAVGLSLVIDVDVDDAPLPTIFEGVPFALLEGLTFSLALTAAFPLAAIAPTAPLASLLPEDDAPAAAAAASAILSFILFGFVGAFMVGA